MAGRSDGREEKKFNSLEYLILIEEVDGKNRVHSAQTLNRPDGLE